MPQPRIKIRQIKIQVRDLTAEWMSSGLLVQRY